MGFAARRSVFPANARPGPITAQPAAESDLKALTGTEKVEVSAASLGLLASAFQTILEEFAKATSIPTLSSTPTLEKAATVSGQQDLNAPPRAIRHRLPDERASITHKFNIAGHEGYINVGLYPNGQPGEIFIRMAKEGSTVSGLMDSFATAISMCLQHGVPLKLLCEKFAHTRFEPSGWTGNQEIGYAKSIMDYIFRWIQIRFLSGQQLDLFAGLGPQQAAPSAESVPVAGIVSAPENTVSLSAPASEAAPAPRSVEAPAPVAPATPAPRTHSTVTGAIADIMGTSDLSPQTILDRERRASQAIPGSGVPVPLSDQDIFNNGPGSNAGMGSGMNPNADRTPPQGGIAPDLAASSGLPSAQNPAPSSLPKDRGVSGIPGSGSGAIHVADAMKSMYDMGDAPSCATCGAIMTRSGSCYRCMSCGNTSGCS